MPRLLRFFSMFLISLALFASGDVGQDLSGAVGTGTAEQQRLNGLAQAAEARGDWKEAGARLRDALKVAPEDLAAHQRLAWALFSQGEAKEAYDILKAAKRIDRETAKKNGTLEVFLTPEAVMAQYYDQFEGPQSTNPEKWFRAAVKKAPDDLTTRQVAALWAFERGKVGFAKEQAEAALRIEASDPQRYGGSFVGRGLRGMVALWEKNWMEAEGYFEKIIVQSATDFVARNNLALALVEQDDAAKKRRALDYAQANYRDNPRSPDALSTLGWVHFRRNEFDQAALVLDQAVKAAGGRLTPRLATYVAHVLYHQDRRWQAKEILENALQCDHPFSMKPEAERLYEKVKDAVKPEAAPAVETR